MTIIQVEISQPPLALDKTLLPLATSEGKLMAAAAR